MADLSAIEGRTYGPAILAPTPATTRGFVAAVGEQSDRWGGAAPPSWAGAVLFAVAPGFLADPDVVGAGGGIVHADQAFSWRRPFTHDIPLEVVGTVARVRSRGSATWVSFSLEATGPDGPVLTAGSTFVVTGDAPPGSVAEPPADVDVRAANDLQPNGATMARSASRADLVAYAAASGDLNPIHWDHDRALRAGLPGVVCHGLLLAAWCTHLATHDLPGDRPLAEARIRFRQPVRPGVDCLLSRQVDGERVEVALTVDDGVAMTFSAVTA